MNHLITSSATARIELSVSNELSVSSVAPHVLTVQLLTNEHKLEVLAFLAVRPVHTVLMTDFISNNGLVSALNRGSFYACRGERGDLEGVALIGHMTLFEVRTEAVLPAFASVAQNCSAARLIVGEQDHVERFWSHYAETGRVPRLVCRELLLEQRQPPSDQLEAMPGLRPATSDDLTAVMAVHAEVAFEESGVDPMKVDPIGFRLRTARRIEQQRVWVWVERGRLIFKADIAASTSRVVYLEGIYVNPEDRGKGYGLHCLAQLSRGLLSRVESVCLLVNIENQRARNLYQRIGYKLHSRYNTVFLQLHSN
ncbi:MAG: GNAT family N-acetyltransferase [Pyrinomonadaceae bacterium]|nr:GNAT family N-acetyltransferase [Pyrinomonadaceae bacterium]